MTKDSVTDRIEKIVSDAQAIDVVVVEEEKKKMGGLWGRNVFLLSSHDVPEITQEDEDQEEDQYYTPFEECAIQSLALELNISLSHNATLALEWLALFTTLRLFLVRVCREYYVFQNIYSFTWHGYTTILQFSYILELIPCAVQLYNDPGLLSDNGWQSTFTNAFVWALVNGVSLGTGHAWLNLIGFAFDILHDYYYTDNKIKSLQAMLDTPQTLSLNAIEIKDITAEIKELKYKKMRLTCVAFFLLIGMGMVYLNPIAPAWVPMVGATLVIFFGGIVGNLGNRLFQWDKFFIRLSNDYKDSSWADIFCKELEIMINAIGKLFKDFIKPLSPTLYSSLENHRKDFGNALSCIISASIPLLLFGYAWHYFSISFFAIAPIYMLPIMGGLLIAIELSARLGAYLYQFKNLNRMDHIIRKLENSSKTQEQKQEKKYTQIFSKFSPQEMKTLAELANMAVPDLLHHINCWNRYSGEYNNTSNTKLSTSGYSFFGFKQKINIKVGTLHNKEKPQLIYIH